MKAYQIKVTVKNSKPPVWRRLIVPSGYSFAQFSMILNEAFGWCGYHLYSFTFAKLGVIFEEIEDDDFYGWMEYEPYEASEYIIDRFMEAQKSFTYVYDFGDYWTHAVSIEKILDDYKENYPQIIKYKGENYPEDCGGVWGYEELMETLKNPNHSEYAQMKEWYEMQFHAFDLENTNAVLKEMKLGKRKVKPRTQNELYENLWAGKPFDRMDGKYVLSE